MGRSNKNARSRPQGRRIHVNKYINKIGRTKDKRAACMMQAVCMKNASRFKNSSANLSGQVSPENPRPWVTGPLPRRYETWFADLGDHYGTSVQSGNRPVLVISNDVGNQYSRTVTVIPMTTKLKRMDMPTHIILTEEDCCMFRPQTLQDSVLLAEQITTIAKSALCGRLCRVTSRERKQEIEQAVATQLDMQRTHGAFEETQPDADAQSYADNIPKNSGNNYMAGVNDLFAIVIIPLQDNRARPEPQTQAGYGRLFYSLRHVSALQRLRLAV